MLQSLVERICQSKTLLFTGVLSALLAIIYGSLVANSRFVDYDDKFVVGPVQRVESLGMYIDMHRTSEILDLAPVRDLSYFLDFQIGSALGVASFHFTNLIAWLALTVVVFLILRSQVKDWRMAFCFGLLVGCHPMFVNSVAWITARKHILAAFFGFSMILAIIRDSKRGSKESIVGGTAALILYWLSALSHPIYILTPIWCVFYFYVSGGAERVRGHRKLVLSLIMSMILLLAANFYYYSSETYTGIGSSKFAKSTFGFEQILAVGRYAFQLFIPFWLTISDHAVGAWQNYIGLIGGVAAFLYLILNRSSDLIVRSWLVLSILSVGVVHARLTNVFASDTYAIMFCIAFLLAVANQISRLPDYLTKPTLVVMLCLTLGSTVLANRQAQFWRDDFRLWQVAYQIEPTAQNAVAYGIHLVKRGSHREAFEIAMLYRETSSHIKNYGYFMGRVVYENPKLSLPEKLRLVDELGVSSPWLAYYRSVILFSLGRSEEAYSGFLPWLADGLELRQEFGADVEVIVAEMTFFCSKSGKSDCQSLGRRMQEDLRASWENVRFLDRLNELSPNR